MGLSVSKGMPFKAPVSFESRFGRKPAIPAARMNYHNLTRMHRRAAFRAGYPRYTPTHIVPAEFRNEVISASMPSHWRFHFDFPRRIIALSRSPVKRISSAPASRSWESSARIVSKKANSKPLPADRAAATSETVNGGASGSSFSAIRSQPIFTSIFRIRSNRSSRCSRRSAHWFSR